MDNSLYEKVNFVFTLLSVKLIMLQLSTAINTVHCQNFIASAITNSILLLVLIVVFIYFKIIALIDFGPMYISVLGFTFPTLDILHLHCIVSRACLLPRKHFAMFSWDGLFFNLTVHKH